MNKFVIFYEQFVTAPRTVLNQLAEKLALSKGGFDCSSVHKKSIGKYQDGLTKDELDQVLSVAGYHMYRLGYHLDRPGFRDVVL